MTEGQARDAADASRPQPVNAADRWQGDGLYARSSRFGLILLAPIGAGILAKATNGSLMRPSGNAFTGAIEWVQIDLGDDDHNHLITPEERFKIAMARQ
jgi:hypothetical protein